MDTKAKRVGLAIFIVAGAMFAFIRRPTGMLIVALVLYHYCERIFGVAPLKPYELSDLIVDAKEATIAAAGIVVAAASVSAFKRVKRLDLELAAGADIKSMMRDASDLLGRNQLYCEKLLELREKYLESISGDGRTAEQRGALRSEVAIRWEVLMSSVQERRSDQEETWNLPRRLTELKNQHSAILQSKVVTPWLLERAQHHLEIVVDAAEYPIPAEDNAVRDFVPTLLMAPGKRARSYLDADEKDAMKFFGYMGGASVIGSTSVAPSSVINAVRTAWRLWKM